MKISRDNLPDNVLLIKPMVFIVLLACLSICLFLIGTEIYLETSVREYTEALTTLKYISIGLLIVVLMPSIISIYMIIKNNKFLVKEIIIREKIEEILEKSEARYRTIFDNARDGIFQSTTEGRLINVNPAFARIMGYETPGEMIDGVTNIDQVYADPEERKKVLRIINEKGFIDNYHLRIKHRSGNLLWISFNARVIRDEKGEILYYEGSLEDITKRKETEDAVINARKMLDDILRAASEFAIIATDSNGIITVFNRGAELMLGYSSDEIIGKHTPLILHDDLEIAARGRKLTAELGYPVEGFRIVAHKPEMEGRQTVECTFVCKDGSRLPVSLVVYAIRSETGTFSGVVGIATDLTKRKKTEVEIRRLASIVRHSSEMVSLAELDGQMVFINDAGSKLLGIDPGETEKINFMQLIPEHLKNTVENDILPKVLDCGIWDGDLQFINLKTGAVTDIHSLNFTIDDPGALYKKYWVIISLDISPQKHAEKMVREKDAVLSSIAKNMPGVVFQFYATDSGEWGVSYVNERLTEIFGVPFNPVTMFKDVFDHIHQDDKERFNDSIRKAVKTCSPWDFEGRFLRDSGELVWFHGLSTPRRHDDRIIFDGLFLNISKNKQAEELSRISEEKFTKIFMMAPEMAAITRMEDGLIADVNIGFEEITGWKRDEVLGRTSYDLNFWDNPDDRASMVDELKAGSDVVHREILFRHKNGTLRTGIYSARFIEIAGEPHLIFVMQDITEMRLLEEERRKLEQQLNMSQKMDAIGKLAGGIAHDFNNILMGIQGNASMSMMEFNPENPHYQRMSRIEEHVTRGANLTRQLLGFAREGKYELKILSMNDILSKTAQLFIESRKEVEVNFQLQEDLYHVEIDAGQMEQVLLNIFINAGHAMPKGGCISIQTSNITLKEKEAVGFEISQGDYIRISISDTGTGMDAKTLEKIFEPFFTTKAEQGGTGLGLASAYGIIRNHGGAINAYSEPGQGATFNIYLPSSEKKIEKEEDCAMDKSLFQGRGGILVVDDEPSILEIASEILKMLGYTLYKAENAQEAVFIYREKQDMVDLIILDMILKGTSGSQVLNMLREINPDVKVILSSGYSLQGEVKKVMDMGCIGFIQKPYNFVEFSRVVHDALNQ